VFKFFDKAAAPSYCKCNAGPILKNA
jgi:hypothetical protein